MFVIKDLLNTSRPGHHLGQLELLAYIPVNFRVRIRVRVMIRVSFLCRPIPE